jgi:hypothetical protein
MAILMIKEESFFEAKCRDGLSAKFLSLTGFFPCNKRRLEVLSS